MADQQDKTTLITMRLPNRVSGWINEVVKRWKCNRTDILLEGTRLQVDPNLRAIIGDRFGATGQALFAFADLVEEASQTVTLSRAEWNYLAQANPDLPLSSASPTLLWVNANDSHRRTRLGDEFFPKGKGDSSIKTLVEKLQSLTPLQSWSAVLAVQFQATHRDDIDPAKDEWWTVRYRREVALGG